MVHVWSPCEVSLCGLPVSLWSRDILKPTGRSFEVEFWRLLGRPRSAILAKIEPAQWREHDQMPSYPFFSEKLCGLRTLAVTQGTARTHMIGWEFVRRPKLTWARTSSREVSFFTNTRVVIRWWRPQRSQTHNFLRCIFEFSYLHTQRAHG